MKDSGAELGKPSWGSGLGGRERASGDGDSTLRTSDCGRVVKRGHQKCLLTGEVKATENTNKDQTTRHKKVKAMALILC